MDVSEEYRRRLETALGSGFVVESVVGSGGFGVVFKARDLRLARTVAVKALRPDIALTPELLTRFRREAQAVARLRHPHIVPVYSVSEDDTLAYMVMPYVEGQSLGSLLATERRLPDREVARILREAASALQCAHDAGIVHRDVKPENIMLEGPDRRVLLMDFGIAKAAAAGATALTGSGVAIGTPAYMSPEQVAGDQALGPYSDLYSLGVVAFQMVAGHLPFESESAQEVMMQHLGSPVPKLPYGEGDEAIRLRSAIAKCLVKKPALRWSSGRELMEALESPSGSHVAQKPARRRIGFALISVAVPMLAVGLVLFGRDRRDALAPAMASTAWRMARLDADNFQVISGGDSLLVVSEGGQAFTFDGATWQRPASRVEGGFVIGGAELLGRWMAQVSMGTGDTLELRRAGSDSFPLVARIAGPGFGRPFTAGGTLYWEVFDPFNDIGARHFQWVQSHWVEMDFPTKSSVSYDQIVTLGDRVLALGAFNSIEYPDSVVYRINNKWTIRDVRLDRSRRTAYWALASVPSRGVLYLAGDECPYRSQAGCIPLLMSSTDSGEHWRRLRIPAPPFDGEVYRPRRLLLADDGRVLLSGSYQLDGVGDGFSRGPQDDPCPPRRDCTFSIDGDRIGPVAELRGLQAFGAGRLLGRTLVFSDYSLVWTNVRGTWVPVANRPTNGLAGAIDSKAVGMLELDGRGNTAVLEFRFAPPVVLDSGLRQILKRNQVLALAASESTLAIAVANHGVVWGRCAYKPANLVGGRGLIPGGATCQLSERGLVGGDSVLQLVAGDQGDYYVGSTTGQVLRVHAGGIVPDGFPAAHSRSSVKALSAGFGLVAASVGDRVFFKSLNGSEWKSVPYRLQLPAERLAVTDSSSIALIERKGDTWRIDLAGMRDSIPEVLASSTQLRGHPTELTSLGSDTLAVAMSDSTNTPALVWLEIFAGTQRRRIQQPLPHPINISQLLVSGRRLYVFGKSGEGLSIAVDSLLAPPSR